MNPHRRRKNGDAHLAKELHFMRGPQLHLILVKEHVAPGMKDM
jgi:hypothetical protein